MQSMKVLEVRLTSVVKESSAALFVQAGIDSGHQGVCLRMAGVLGGTCLTMCGNPCEEACRDAARDGRSSSYQRDSPVTHGHDPAAWG
ncbi:hypothetical protein [Streptomyces sp. NPDC098101]|uniref:hypothetical protein n=1 Tax=Streptomyces sp. NPDC098101 TaxID=3366096 RepID=UPI003809C686